MKGWSVRKTTQPMSDTFSCRYDATFLMCITQAVLSNRYIDMLRHYSHSAVVSGVIAADSRSCLGSPDGACCTDKTCQHSFSVALGLLQAHE